MQAASTFAALRVVPACFRAQSTSSSTLCNLALTARLGQRATGAYATSAAAGATLEWTDSDALVKLLDSKAPGVLVLDVRSPEELPAGSIRGSLNLPTPLFKQADTGPLDKAIHEHIKQAKEVVVHCLLCVPGKRGPTAAAALQARLAALHVSPAPRVTVLTGGIDAFIDKYGSRTDLVSLPPGGWKRPAH